MAAVLEHQGDIARARQPAARATLRCRIRTRDGQRIEGNLQIEAKHQGSGVVWKGFRYRDGEHFFRGLPHGDYRVCVSAAGFLSTRASAVLFGSETILDVVLEFRRSRSSRDQSGWLEKTVCRRSGARFWRPR